MLIFPFHPKPIEALIHIKDQQYTQTCKQTQKQENKETTKKDTHTQKQTKAKNNGLSQPRPLLTPMQTS